ncbi:MAG: outer membrane protein [Spirochaetota bacterium]
MKTKILAILAAFALVCAFTVNASAQTMLTDDVAFVKLGYSMMKVDYDEEYVDELEGNGFNLQGEYNLNLGSVLLGFGLEYTYMPVEVSGTDVDGDDYSADYTLHYLSPMLSAKFITAGGFYLGAGLAGKYLVGQSAEEKGDDTVFDEEIDLWANGLIGFMTPIQEFVYLDIEGRFGYNLTNKQFEKTKASEYEIKSQYDIAIYVGVGYRVAARGF